MGLTYTLPVILPATYLGIEHRIDNCICISINYCHSLFIFRGFLSTFFHISLYVQLTMVLFNSVGNKWTKWMDDKHT